MEPALPDVQDSLRPLLLGLLAAACAVPLACGQDEDAGEDGRADASDRPAKPPRGWRTVPNREAGFTVAAPRSFTATSRRGATVIRSPDRLLVITLAADRSRQGRETRPREYVRETFAALPGFEGAVGAPTRGVPGSPYPSALLEGAGRVNTNPRPQRIAVAAFQLPGRVTYTAVGFRNARVAPTLHARTLRRVLASLRAAPRD